MRLFGHPIHPMLVHFPVALWTVAAGAYVASWLGLADAAATVAKLCNGAGLLVALVAMLAGLIELRSIERGSAALQVATWHMMVMATVWFCFVLALVLPISPAIAPPTARLAAAACAAVGFVLMGIGGWLGGRLVYEFGVGVKSARTS